MPLDVHPIFGEINSVPPNGMLVFIVSQFFPKSVEYTETLLLAEIKMSDVPINTLSVVGKYSIFAIYIPGLEVILLHDSPPLVVSANEVLNVLTSTAIPFSESLNATDRMIALFPSEVLKTSHVKPLSLLL